MNLTGMSFHLQLSLQKSTFAIYWNLGFLLTSFLASKIAKGIYTVKEKRDLAGTSFEGILTASSQGSKPRVKFVQAPIKVTFGARPTLCFQLGTTNSSM